MKVKLTAQFNGCIICNGCSSWEASAWHTHLHQRRRVRRIDGAVHKPTAKDHPTYEVRKREQVVVALKKSGVHFVLLENLQQFAGMQKGVGNLGDDDSANNFATALIQKQCTQQPRYRNKMMNHV